MDRQERLDALRTSGYLDTITGWARQGCAPVYFRDDGGKLHNGTMTIVDTGATVLGLTAGHVADDISRYCDETTPGRGCQVGTAELDPSRLIDRHPTLDLATYQLSPQLAAVTRHAPITVSTWPPAAPAEGEVVLFGGYPAMFTEERERQFDVAFVWFGLR